MLATLLALHVASMVHVPIPRALAMGPAPTVPTLTWPKPPPSDWLDVSSGCAPARVAAVGDGSADDTASIQACFDLINNESSKHTAVYMPAGNYTITSTLKLFRVKGGLVVGDGGS